MKKVDFQYLLNRMAFEILEQEAKDRAEELCRSLELNDNHRGLVEDAFLSSVKDRYNEIAIRSNRYYKMIIDVIEESNQ